MKLSHRVGNFKWVFASEIIEFAICIDEISSLFKHKVEQNVCDTYKSKIEHLKSFCNKKEFKKINEEFVSK